MLRSLHVEHYVLIDSLEIRFPEGFIVLTGQTGAGKSILLGALSLLMGAKADAGMISDGADSCVVEGEFDGRGDAALEAAVKAEDLDWADGQLLIRRVVSRSGRSRAFLNDEPVSLPVLTALSARLVDIHSQHQTLLLTDRKTQLSMLDFFAGDAETLAAYRQCWRALQERRAELNRVREEAARLREEQDFLRSRYETLSAAKLREGELAGLEAEQQLLANAEQIKESLCRAESLFTPVEEDRASLSATLKDIVAQLEKAGRYIPSLLPLAERTASARLELDDIADELSAVNARTDVSTDRLTQVEDRIGTLYELMRRFSAAGEAELIAERDRLAGLLEGCETASDRQAALEKEVAALEKELAKQGSALSKAREGAAKPFAAEVKSLLKGLELDKAAFLVEIAPAAPGPDGADAVTFRFSATGTAPVELARCASGGELSRIMLCLKALMARYTKMPTLLFDEIDTGVSGSVADKMGAMLSRMGGDMQVFAITHLPQVAVRGSAHYLVEKAVAASGAAVTSIHPLDADARIRETARLLSGAAITPAALANAKALLSEAQSR